MNTFLQSHTRINVQLRVTYIYKKSPVGLKEKRFTSQEHGIFLGLKVKLCKSAVCKKSLIWFQFTSNPAPDSYYSLTNILGLRSTLIYIFCIFIICVGSAPGKKSALNFIIQCNFSYGLDITWPRSPISQAWSKKYLGDVAM